MDNLTGKRFTGPLGIRGRVVEEFTETDGTRKVRCAFDGSIGEQVLTRSEVDEAVEVGMFKEVSE